jgi:hypothetical protein
MLDPEEKETKENTAEMGTMEAKVEMKTAMRCE